MAEAVRGVFTEPKADPGADALRACTQELAGWHQPWGYHHGLEPTGVTAAALGVRPGPNASRWATGGDSMPDCGRQWRRGARADRPFARTRNAVLNGGGGRSPSGGTRGCGVLLEPLLAACSRAG